MGELQPEEPAADQVADDGEIHLYCGGVRLERTAERRLIELLFDTTWTREKLP